MPEVAECVEEIKDLVTSRYLENLFKRGSLTILHWRARLGLPYVRIPGDDRDTIRFRLPAVKEWAKLRSKRMFPLPEVLENKRIRYTDAEKTADEAEDTTADGSHD